MRTSVAHSRSARARSESRFLLTAAFLTLAGPTALLFLFPLLLWTAGRDGRRPRALAGEALLAGACAISIAPVAIANIRSTRRPVLIQGHGGLNFYIGNSPSGTGLPTVRPGEAWDRLEKEPLPQGISLPADQDRYFYDKTFREIRRAPFSWAKLLAAKALWAVQTGEIRDTFKASSAGRRRDSRRRARRRGSTRDAETRG